MKGIILERRKSDSHECAAFYGCLTRIKRQNNLPQFRRLILRNHSPIDLQYSLA